MPPFSKYDEKELLRLLKFGDRDAFTQLYNLHSERLLCNLLRLVKSREMALEILQDIFVKIWDRREKIDVQRSFGSYLSRVGENLIYDFYRKVTREKKQLAQFRASATEDFVPAEDSVLNNESEFLLKKAIENLPPQRKKVFELCKIEGKSYSEVSNELGISTSTINDHVVKATRMIRVFMHTNNATAFYLIGTFILNF